MFRSVAIVVVIAVLGASACSGSLSSVYPARPQRAPGAPIAEAPPSRVVVHLTMTGGGLKAALDEALPKTATGTVPILGSERRYTWTRVLLASSFMQGRVRVQATVDVELDLPVSTARFPVNIDVLGEPVLSADYRLRLQSVTVSVSSDDRRLKIAQTIGGTLDKIKAALETELAAFAFDLKPLLGEAARRLTAPLEFTIGDAKGCLSMDLLGIEAGPTVLADGLEKDLALLVTPKVTLPCAVPAGATPVLPPLQNVAALPSGPFVITIPLAANYDELARAMGMAFPNGRLHFSTEFPGLYLEKPEIYPSRDQLVVKVRLRGPVKKGGISTTLDGDLYLSGHPSIADNELTVPDLEPTLDTKSFLLKLAASIKGDEIRDQARQALRLDLTERMKQVRERLSTELTFDAGKGCARAHVDAIDVAGLHPHASYLRLWVKVTARAAVNVPCQAAP